MTLISTHMKGEIFVNIKMNKMVSLDSQSVIPMMVEKYKKGRCIIPTKFCITDIRASPDRLELTISSMESFGLEDIKVE